MKPQNIKDNEAILKITRVKITTVKLTKVTVKFTLIKPWSHRNLNPDCFPTCKVRTKSIFLAIIRMGRKAFGMYLEHINPYSQMLISLLFSLCFIVKLRVGRCFLMNGYPYPPPQDPSQGQTHRGLKTQGTTELPQAHHFTLVHPLCNKINFLLFYLMELIGNSHSKQI